MALSLYVGNEFFWRSPRLRQMDGTAWPASATAQGWIALVAGGSPIYGQPKTATQSAPGQFSFSYSLDEVARITANRIGTKVVLVLVIDGDNRYETAVSIVQSRPPA